MRQRVTEQVGDQLRDPTSVARNLFRNTKRTQDVSPGMCGL